MWLTRNVVEHSVCVLCLVHQSIGKNEFQMDLTARVFLSAYGGERIQGPAEEDRLSPEDPAP